MCVKQLCVWVSTFSLETQQITDVLKALQDSGKNLNFQGHFPIGTNSEHLNIV